MRASLLKWSLILAALLFADWLIMVLFGCAGGLCHAGNKFFCSVFCITGIVLLSLTFAFYGFLILKSLFPGKPAS